MEPSLIALYLCCLVTFSEGIHQNRLYKKEKDPTADYFESFFDEFEMPPTESPDYPDSEDPFDDDEDMVPNIYDLSGDIDVNENGRGHDDYDYVSGRHNMEGLISPVEAAAEAYYFSQINTPGGLPQGFSVHYFIMLPLPDMGNLGHGQSKEQKRNHLLKLAKSYACDGNQAREWFRLITSYSSPTPSCDVMYSKGINEKMNLKSLTRAFTTNKPPPMTKTQFTTTAAPDYLASIPPVSPEKGQKEYAMLRPPVDTQKKLEQWKQFMKDNHLELNIEGIRKRKEVEKNTFDKSEFPAVAKKNYRFTRTGIIPREP